MADQYVVLPSDAGNTGRKVDATELSVSAQTVERQRVHLGGAGAAELGDVKAARAAMASYGLVTREAPKVDGWSATHAPAANAQASASKAAGGAGVRHVCTGVSVTLAGGAAAPTAGLVTVNLRDGATGAGSILATWTMAVEAVAGKLVQLHLQGMELPGTANTAMTLETSAAPGANVSASCNLFGYSAS